MDSKRLRRRVLSIIGCLMLTAILLASALADPDSGVTVGAPITIDLTDIVTAAIGLMGALITAYVIPWVRRRTSLDQQRLLKGTVDMLVYGADKLCASGAISDKLQFVEDELRARGFIVDRAAIEAAVKRLDLDDTRIEIVKVDTEESSEQV